MKNIMTLVSPCLFVVLSLMARNKCNAQQSDKSPGHFHQRAHILFEDDFSRDDTGAFPAGWRFSVCDKLPGQVVPGSQLHLVETDGSSHALVMRSTARYMEPEMPTGHYLPDSFTVETDFAFDTSGCAELYFYAKENKGNCPLQCLHILSTGVIGETGFPNDTGTRFFGRFPFPFHARDRHHLAIAYRNGNYDVYGDGKHLATLSHPGVSPYAAALSCIAPVRFYLFRIADGREAGSPADLLTGKKLVTHAILFDLNKWAIRPESNGFMLELSKLLKDNPDIKLEVQGHTDSVGDAAVNKMLSQRRADEVKKQLVLLGVREDRLNAKGYGATKPIQPNTTQAGRDNNRRVEFVRR